MSRGGYYISDIVTAFVAAGVRATVLEPGSTVPREVSIPELTALGDAAPVAYGSLVLSMRAPPMPSTSKLWIDKVMQRATHSDRIVTFGAYFDVAANGSVADARVLVGGASEAMLIPKKTLTAIIGKKLDDASFKAASAALLEEIRAKPSTDPLHTAAYRESVALGFLYKAYLAMQKNLPPPVNSAIVPFIPPSVRPISSGTESFGTVPAENPIGTYVPKLTARCQASGEATYASDSAVGALFGQLVFSTTANATLKSLDPVDALKLPGVVGFVGAGDVPGTNCIATTLKSPEKVFYNVGDKIPCIGVGLGLVLACTWQQARAAAQQVKQVYGSSAVVTTMDQACALGHTPTPTDLDRAEGLMEGSQHHARRGLKPLAAMHASGRVAPNPQKSAAKELKATFKTGGQRHWYMETQSVVVTPVDGRWEFLISDQDPNYSAENLAAVLDVSMNQVNCIQRRAGGGFGGKLTRQMPLAAACAVAAYKFGKQVRAQNYREDDLQMVAGREPITFDYDVSFEANGKVDTMDLKMKCDVGWAVVDNVGDLQMAQGWSDNCYHYNSFKATYNPLLTDTPVTTSMRAPGCMQSLIAAEVVMEHIAKTLGKATEDVMQLNWYKEGDSTPFGDTIGKEGYNFTIPVLWEQLQKDADYAARKQAVAAYNEKNRWTKKGIAISSVKYVAGINYYSSGAHICVYADGTVLVSHGGCEIGQGIHTKVALCVAQTLGIPLEKISVGTTETAKVPNNTSTGGSGTSECSSQAAILAAEDIVARLASYRTSGKTWEDAVTQANVDGVNLMASKWFKAEKKTNTNQYSTYGCAVSEVLVDVLTGEVRVEQSDIILDLGTQLDAAVDLGQIEGGFVMALGYLLTEQLIVDSTGAQLSTSAYKIPGAYDIPLKFNCSLLKNSPSPVGIKGSKLVAEPVMALTASAYLAVKQAIYAARKDAGLGEAWFMLDMPCTPEHICAAIGTPQTQLVVPA
jgi:xanthine dehydrogenase/oxidase